DSRVAVTGDVGAAAAGFEALAHADWPRARESLEAALVAGDESPEVLDALGRTLWWLRDAEGAVVQRERAYAGFRRQGELARAARIALWLSREYGLVWRNDAAANGWLARAERLLTAVAPGAEHGWLVLARSERARDPREAVELAERALATATAAVDADLELRALAQLGLAEVSDGMVDEGLGRLDEAMAAATAGERSSLETFADVCCTLILACELAGDDERPKQWSQVFESFVRTYDHVPLLAFCRTCGADVSAANGRIDDAERELVAALRELTQAGQRARCVHPAARLAEIRVLQGRFDEAAGLLADFADEPETINTAVNLRLARGAGGSGNARRAATRPDQGVERARRPATRTPRRSAACVGRDRCRRGGGSAARSDRRRHPTQAGRGRCGARARPGVARDGRSVGSGLARARRRRVRRGRSSARRGARTARAGPQSRAIGAADRSRPRPPRPRRAGGDGSEPRRRRRGRAPPQPRRQGPRRPAKSRPAEQARARGAAASRRRPQQRRDRESPQHQPEDGRAPLEPDLRQARPGRPLGGSRLRRAKSRGRIGDSPLPAPRGQAHHLRHPIPEEAGDVRREQGARTPLLPRVERRQP